MESKDLVSLHVLITRGSGTSLKAQQGTDSGDYFDNILVLMAVG